jgi:rare lipoprotein A
MKFFKTSRNIILTACVFFLLQTQSLAQTQNEITPEAIPSPTFSDIQENTQYFVAIEYLRQKSIIQGFEDGKFRPDQKITRAEALSIILKNFHSLETMQQTTATIDFPDVGSEDWFSDLVDFAVEKNIITGFDDGLFRPHENITRAQALAIILRTKEPANENAPENFSDVEQSAWYAPYFLKVKEAHIMPTNKRSQIFPDAEITRGELAELIYKFIKHQEGSFFGSASFYGDYLIGRNMATGRPYNHALKIAANLKLPFGTMIEVTNLQTGKSVTVEIADRGPYGHPDRKIDLSQSAFSQIASLSSGHIQIEYKIINND